MDDTTQLYPNLDRKRIIRDADRGRVRHTDSGYDIHERDGLPKAVRITSEVVKMQDAGWLVLADDGHWRPTELGAQIADIAPGATR